MKKGQALCLMLVILLMVPMFSGCEDTPQFVPQLEIEDFPTPEPKQEEAPVEEVEVEEEQPKEETPKEQTPKETVPENKSVTPPAEKKTETPQTETKTTPKTEPQGTTVYVTETGEKYHRDGCRYLSKSKIPISLSNTGGYSPCSVCKPPTK